jgi:hypothetical protein
MERGLAEVVAEWAEAIGMPVVELAPSRSGDNGRTLERFGPDSIRPGATADRLDDWERRHDFSLPRTLRAWLLLSDGLFLGEDPLVHPVEALGPMIPFARVPTLVIQPESWYELGNPGRETICMDLAYRWPGDDHPLFTSGDDLIRTKPRLIATGFASWLIRLLNEGGRSYWFDPGFRPLGDPWLEHRRHAPTPPLPGRLKPYAARVRPLLCAGADDRDIAMSLGITRWDVEALVRHLQHAVPGL